MQSKPTSQDVIDKKQHAEEDKDTHQSFHEDGKVDINMLLHKYLPGGVTLREFEDLAISLHDKIRDVWEASEHWHYVNKE